jgi:hypothetical protein
VSQITDPAMLAKHRDLIDGVGAMLQTLRSPFIETLVLFATRRGRIVASHVLTSGALNFVSAEGENGRDLVKEFLMDAVLSGATHVHTAHNHPSGDPNPSGIGYDLSMWAGYTRQAEVFGLKGGVNLVIDDDEYTITEFEPEPDGALSATPRFLPYHYSPKVPWFEPPPGGITGQVRSPESAATIVHRLGKGHNGYLIHMDSHGRICGLDPFTPADVAAGAPIVDQVAAAMERYGSGSTIIGLPGDRDLYHAVLELYRNTSPLQRVVVDIINLRTTPAGVVIDGAPPVSAADMGAIRYEARQRLEAQWAATMVGRRVHEPGPMAVPWRGQPGYTTDAAVQGSRSYQLPAGLPADGPLSVREAVGPSYGEDGLPNTASVIAQEALDAAEKLGIAPTAEGTIGKLLTAFAGTRMEQIGAPLHLVLVEYERQRAELEQLVQ